MLSDPFTLSSKRRVREVASGLALVKSCIFRKLSQCSQMLLIRMKVLMLFFFLSVGTRIDRGKDTRQSDVFEEEEECVRSEGKSALPCR